MTSGGGTVVTDREMVHELLDEFAQWGGYFVDTANCYSGGKSERLIGEWLVDRGREEYIIDSKVSYATTSRSLGPDVGNVGPCAVLKVRTGFL